MGTFKVVKYFIMASLMFSFSSFLTVHYYDMLKKAAEEGDEKARQIYKHNNVDTVKIERGPFIPQNGAEVDKLGETDYTEEEQKARNTYKDMYEDDEAATTNGIAEMEANAEVEQVDEKEIELAKRNFDRLIVNPIEDQNARGKISFDNLDNRYKLRTWLKLKLGLIWHYSSSLALPVVDTCHHLKAPSSRFVLTLPFK